jgi:hypothetical protein
MQDTDQKQRVLAILRHTERRDFALHAVVFVAVNAFILVLWGVSDEHGFFWPVWSLLGWGIGLAVHATRVFFTDPTEADIEAEMSRLKPEQP